MGGEKNLTASLDGHTTAAIEQIETGTGTNSPSRDNSKVQTERNTLDSDKTSLVKQLQVSALILDNTLPHTLVKSTSTCLSLVSPLDHQSQGKDNEQRSVVFADDSEPESPLQAASA